MKKMLLLFLGLYGSLWEMQGEKKPIMDIEDMWMSLLAMPIILIQIKRLVLIICNSTA